MGVADVVSRSSICRKNGCYDTVSDTLSRVPADRRRPFEIKKLSISFYLCLCGLIKVRGGRGSGGGGGGYRLVVVWCLAVGGSWQQIDRMTQPSQQQRHAGHEAKSRLIAVY